MTSPRRAAVSSTTLLIIVVGLAITGFAIFRFVRGGGAQPAGGTVQMAGGDSLSGDPAKHPVAFKPAFSIDKATSESAVSGKPLLLLFTAEWCGPCQSLKKNALADASVVQAVQGSTYPVFVDCTATLPQIGADLGVEGYPTLMLVKNGKEVSRITGSASASAITAWIAKNTT